MKIMVLDVAAESGGAVTILDEFYEMFKKDKENKYYFVLSVAKVNECNNIKVLYYPWIKKSWMHRIFFDNVIAPNIIKKYNIGQVISLQNIIVPHTKVKQKVYEHNALPFSDVKISIFKDARIWIYQNIIAKKIIRSIEDAYEIIVQTEWMKKKIIEKIKVSEKKIRVIFPELKICVSQEYKKNILKKTIFFYPANEAIFKNHKVIIEACLKLKNDGIANYEVVFTLNENVPNHLKKYYKIIKKEKLPISFVGNLTKEEVYEYYSKSILIFPSYIETIGLPILEAQKHKCPIIVADMNYSRDLVKDYNQCILFNPRNADMLMMAMKKMLDSREL